MTAKGGTPEDVRRQADSTSVLQAETSIHKTPCFDWTVAAFRSVDVEACYHPNVIDYFQ